VLGNKNAAMVKAHEHHSDLHKQVVHALHAPSLYDECIMLLGRNGFEVGALGIDWAQPHAFSEAVENAWLTVYRAPEKYWALYELAEELVDLEDTFRQWRFRHVTTVERIIGFKRGTGGTPGVPYLRKMLDVVLFPELWQVRTDL
jgi:tryptophan 2,3-dioxygenase